MVPTKLAPQFLLYVCAAMLMPATAHADINAYLADPAALAKRLRDIDPLVNAARQHVAATRAASEQARVLPNPQLAAELAGITLGKGNAYMGVQGPTALGDTGNVSIGISELVEIGKRRERRSAADARSAEAREQSIAALGARLGDAIDVLGRLAYVAAKHQVVDENLAAARKLLALERVRLEHKDLAPVEIERIELDTRALEVEQRRADADLRGAVAACSVLLQTSCSPTEVDATTLDHAAPLPAVLPATDAAISARPDRVASRLEVNALSWDARLAEHRKIPDPTIGLGYTHDAYQYGGAVPNTAMVSVAIPLPLFDRGGHDAEAARATARATAAEDEAQVRVAKATIADLLARRETLTQTLQQLEQESIPSSTRIIEQTRKAFDLGQSGLADLLLVERAHRDLLLEVLDTRFELFEVRAQLRAELGIDDDIARSVEHSP